MATDGWSWPKVAVVGFLAVMGARSLGGNFEKAADSVVDDAAKGAAVAGAGYGAGKGLGALGSAAAGRVAAGGGGGGKAPAKSGPASPAKPAESSTDKQCLVDVPLGGINMKMPTQCPKGPGEELKKPDLTIPEPASIPRLKE